MHNNNTRARPLHLQRYGFALICFIVVSGIIFLPVLNKSFLSDDYQVLKRITLDDNLFPAGFFRPLSDLSLYFSFALSGLDPFYFNITNILLHASCALLVMIFAEKLFFSNELRNVGLLGAVLFLVYPFHNEAVVWAISRGILLAAIFAMASLICVTSLSDPKNKHLFAAFFYFISLGGYESAMFTPLIIVMLLHRNKTWRTERKVFLSYFSLAIATHFILRILISGSMIGDYGSSGINFRLIPTVVSSLKVMGRMFVPPIHNSSAFIISVALTYVLVAIFLIRFFRRVSDQTRNDFFFLCWCLLISLSIPIVFRVSTKTSESDRLFYFPSIFLCLLVSFSIFSAIKKFRYQIVIFALGISYSIFFLSISNYHWRKASEISSSLISIAKDEAQEKSKTYFVNVPDEANGAYIFQNGFKEALILNNLDASQYVLVNKLSIDEQSLTEEEYVPLNLTTSIYIPPSTTIVRTGDGWFLQSVNGKHSLAGNFNIWYFDKRAFRKLVLQ